MRTRGFQCVKAWPIGQFAIAAQPCLYCETDVRNIGRRAPLYGMRHDRGGTLANGAGGHLQSNGAHAGVIVEVQANVQNAAACARPRLRGVLVGWDQWEQRQIGGQSQETRRVEFGRAGDCVLVISHNRYWSGSSSPNNCARRSAIIDTNSRENASAAG